MQQHTAGFCGFTSSASELELQSKLHAANSVTGFSGFASVSSDDTASVSDVWPPGDNTCAGVQAYVSTSSLLP